MAYRTLMGPEGSTSQVEPSLFFRQLYLVKIQTSVLGMNLLLVKSFIPMLH